MKKLSLILCGFFCTAVADAATVNWGAAIDTGIITTTATGSAALPIGNYLLLGYFTGITDAQIQLAAQTSSGVNGLLTGSNFVRFDFLTVGTGTGAAGSFTKGSTLSYAANPSFVPGSQMAFIALNSTNLTSLAAAENSATQIGITYVRSSFNANWAFPASDIATAPNVDLTQLAPADGNHVYDAGNYVPTSSASLTASGFPSTNKALQLQTVLVPEPSALTLLAFAAFGAAGFRRRNQK